MRIHGSGPMEREIRAAEGNDLEALAALYRRCRLVAEWLPRSERSRVDFGRDTQGEKIFVSIAADGTLEGFVSVWEPQSFVHHLYVRPESRGQGIGGLLLEHLEGRLALPWRLKCVRANAAALAFYAKRGWREVGAGTGPQGPHVVLEWVTPP
jgi:GNAT superfamily N-acetyltransferase